MNTTVMNFNLEKAHKIMKALAHPMRIQIVDLLRKNGMMCVTDIYMELNIEQSTTSHHLGILKEGGILNTKRNGKQIFYSLSSKNFQDLLDCISRCSCI